MSESRRAVVVTVSDRSHRGERVDVTGPRLAELLGMAGWTITQTVVVPDEQDQIAAALTRFCAQGVALVVTTGGTGLGPRDVTPEATRKVISREVPGIAETMRRSGAIKTPLAALSRGISGVHAGTLIVNLPGSPQGAVESLTSVQDILPHAVDVLRAAHFDHGE